MVKHVCQMATSDMTWNDHLEATTKDQRNLDMPKVIQIEMAADTVVEQPPANAQRPDPHAVRVNKAVQLVNGIGAAIESAKRDQGFFIHRTTEERKKMLEQMAGMINDSEKREGAARLTALNLKDEFERITAEISSRADDLATLLFENDGTRARLRNSLVNRKS